MRAVPDLGMESRKARVRLQLPPPEHAARLRVPEAAGTLRPPARGAHRHAAEVCQRAVAHDEGRAARSLDPGDRREEPGRHGVRGSGCRGCADGVMNATTKTHEKVDSCCLAPWLHFAG